MNKRLNFLAGVLSGLMLCNSLSAQQWGDYTLYATMNGTTTVLLDTNGSTFKTWTHTTATKTGYTVYMLPGGTLVRTVARSGNSFTGGPICGEVQKVDYNGNVIWDYVYSTTQYCTHHDICPMPNGNVLLIAYESRTAAEATQAGSSSAITMWPDKIVEVQPTGATTGTVVWEWKAWDHLVQNVDPTKDNYYPVISDHPELLNINYKNQKDWMHMNGVDYNPYLDQITFSSHNLNEIYVIDHSTTTAEAASHSGGNSGKGGDILYRWGNPAAYSASGTAVINVCHDAHWIPETCPNAGRLVCFNNKGVSSTQSSVDQVDVPLSGYNYTITPGQAFSPASYTSRLAASGYTSNMGNSNQLPNGNQLVCVALSGLIYETDPAGNTIWSKTITGSVPQAHRYNACYLNNAAPAIPTISENNGVLTASSAVTYQWYLNGQQIAGASSQQYTPTQSGIYVVRITDVNGCVYQYSAGYNFIINVGINEASELKSVKIYPNPSTGVINIEDGKDTPFQIEVYDATGKMVTKTYTKTMVDLTGMESGLYLLKLTDPDGKTGYSKVYLAK
jgi:hypothetical protein